MMGAYDLANLETRLDHILIATAIASYLRTSTFTVVKI